MNFFDEIMYRLASKTRMRTLFKDTHIDDLQRVIDRMQSLVEEKRSALEARHAKQKEKRASIAEIHQIIEQKGLSLSDLGIAEASSVRTRQQRNIRKLRFEYVTKNGDTVQWYGSTTGRLPADFQAYLKKNGKKRLDCVVHSETAE